MAHGTADWWSRTRALMDLRFRDLTDTPGSYAGKAGTVPEVTALEDGIEFSETIIDAHAVRHENGGADEIDVTDLSGVLNEEQKSSWALVSGKPATFAPSDHATEHEPGGGDAIDPGTFDHDDLAGIVANNHHDRYTDLEAIAALGFTQDTWTPVLNFGGAHVGQTYTTQHGYYITLGNVVIAQCYIRLSNKGVSTGAATIAGLPFGSINSFFPATLLLVGVTYTGQILISKQDAGTSLNVQQMTEAGAFSNLDDTNFINTSYISATIIYLTA